MDVATKTSGGAKKPVAKKRVPGIDKGKIWMAEDFDVLSESELAEWYGLADERQSTECSLFLLRCKPNLR